MSVMMSLGYFQFGMNTAEYQKLKTSQSWRWEKKARFGRKPAKQYLGPDADKKQFEIVIYPQSRSDLTRFQQIKALADQGKPVRLVSAGARLVEGLIDLGGVDLGLWCIEKLDVNEGMFTAEGVALEQKGSLTISEYGEDAI